MTMPNANGQPVPIIPPHAHVAPAQTSYQVGSVMGMTPDGPTKMISLRIEHPTGSSVYLWPAAFATEVGNALIKAGSGLEIAKGFPQPGGPPT